MGKGTAKKGAHSNGAHGSNVRTVAAGAKNARPKAMHDSSQTKEAYSRKNYTNGKKGKHRLATWKRVLIGVGCALVLVAAALGLYSAWYLHQIDSNMQIDDTDLLSSLTPQDNSGVMYTLVLGSDNRTGTYQEGTKNYLQDIGGRSDVIMLVRTDASTKTITLVSIPRDTVVELNGTAMKINEALHQGGSSYAVQTIEDLCGVKISHFAEMDFQDLQDFIDILGGVTVDVPVAITDKDIITGDVISIDAGTQTLDGQHALLFARQREVYGSDQDMNRQSSVRLLLTAIIKNITSRPFTDVPNLVLDLSTCVSTDMSASDMIKLAQAFAGTDLTIYSCTGPYSGEIDAATGLWVVNADAADWAKLMAVVESGGDPSAVEFSNSETAVTTATASSAAADASTSAGTPSDASADAAASPAGADTSDVSSDSSYDSSDDSGGDGNATADAGSGAAADTGSSTGSGGTDTSGTQEYDPNVDTTDEGDA